MAPKQPRPRPPSPRHYALNITANDKAHLRSQLVEIIAALDASTDDDPFAALSTVLEPEVRDEGTDPRPEPGNGFDLWEHEVQRQLEDGERPVTRRDIDRLRQAINEDIERQFREPVRRRSGVAPDSEFRGIETMYQVMLAFVGEFFPPGQAPQMRRLLSQITRDIHAGGDGKQFRLNLAAAKDPTLSRIAKAAATAKVTADRDRWRDADNAIKEKRREIKEADAGKPRNRAGSKRTH